MYPSTRLHLLVVSSLVVACHTGQAPAAPPNDSRTGSSTSPSATPPPSVPMQQVITLRLHQKAVVLGLEIEVADIIVKRDMDGRDYMRVGLRLTAGGDASEVTINTGVPKANFRDYELELHGGSPDDAMFTVRRLRR